MFLIAGGAIFLLDATLIAGVPLLFLIAKRPFAALFCSVAIGALVIIDDTINFDGISYPKTYPLRLVGLPASVMPLSLLIIFASTAICGWAAGRRSEPE
jgi:hypothetical protein